MQENPPDRFCDIVMKGGLTSGVVYPLAIVELADEFRFHSIGGTSAGAIAAAITAAAEYQRVTKNSADGFRRLEKLPEFLGGKTDGESNLLNLFPPAKATRGLFHFAMSFSGKHKWLAAIRIFGVSWPMTFVFLVLAAAVFIIRGFDALSVLLVVLLYLMLAIAALLWSVLYTIPRNRFGFSTGCRPPGRTLPGVTEWLHEELQLASGRTLNDPPLTFGELRDAGIELKMITTALTHGRPYTLPFRELTFHFRDSEWQDYFPPAILAHLRAKGMQKPNAQFNDLYALPPAADLPVVVATRMSLSFPILFTLVPLYAIDFVSGDETTYHRSWFIDGGLSSNFPLNLFDSVLPRWPTFGINLAPPSAARPDEWVWMAESNRDGRAKRFLNIPDHGAGAIGGYIGAALDAIRNWRDNTQMSAPGFFDRVVHIYLDKDEGGLNLDMDAHKVKRLTERGRLAGQKLRARFGVEGATAKTLNWNTHRWARYKIAMTMLQKAMRSLDLAFRSTEAAYPHYHTLLRRTKEGNPKTLYWWETKAKRVAYQQLTYDFLQCAAKIRNAPDFDEERPRGKPELRITART